MSQQAIPLVASTEAVADAPSSSATGSLPARVKWAYASGGTATLGASLMDPELTLTSLRPRLCACR